MKRHVALTLLAITVVVVIDLHVDWHRTDNGVLLRAGEQDIDVRGLVRQAWTRWTRRCGAVVAVPADDPLRAASLASIRGYSPPDSRSARLVNLWRHGDWLLAQVESDTLMPAMVTLRARGAAVSIVPRGVWSGNTAPWKAAPLIRDYLLRQVPELPQALADCFDIDPDSALQRPIPAFP